MMVRQLTMPITVQCLYTALSSCQGAAVRTDFTMRSSIHCVGRTYASHSEALCRGQVYAYVSVLLAVTNSEGIHMSQRDRCSVQCLRGDNS